ncbi:hypothetical protein TBLA_0A07570 [Henningerozyma blattae CBS 6284]|uniref:DNA replication checkpoint mediator MRC1 domain-containing protein n=1 Tax=Henningerozyma blattae (strain ATCC 34711 / CBS 6284 / DSM 70876 / NBRC 10599 / NRRL Y-10934 / UCD 77-7) TaxID=1071380 RepID=I2GWP5_HENB6|nr:hypothetical protein TBLA_0A07570 [Tetrapisispora blattae CBS 6284]CCH58547.1 hypothetical protein TBLA_0A07570 [Tetrapisispora blattae CBS 6284]
MNMDAVFDSLDELKIKKRTTYKKVPEQVATELDKAATTISNPVPSFNLSEGFLFANDKLEKIKNRLNLGSKSNNTTTGNVDIPTNQNKFSDQYKNSLKESDDENEEILFSQSQAFLDTYNDTKNEDDRILNKNTEDVIDEAEKSTTFTTNYIRPATHLNFRNTPNNIHSVTQEITQQTQLISSTQNIKLNSISYSHNQKSKLAYNTYPNESLPTSQSIEERYRVEDPVQTTQDSSFANTQLIEDSTTTSPKRTIDFSQLKTQLIDSNKTSLLFQTQKINEEYIAQRQQIDNSQTQTSGSFHFSLSQTKELSEPQNISLGIVPLITKDDYHEQSGTQSNGAEEENNNINNNSNTNNNHAPMHISLTQNKPNKFTMPTSAISDEDRNSQRPLNELSTSRLLTLTQIVPSSPGKATADDPPKGPLMTLPEKTQADLLNTVPNQNDALNEIPQTARDDIFQTSVKDGILDKKLRIHEIQDALLQEVKEKEKQTEHHIQDSDSLTKTKFTFTKEDFLADLDDDDSDAVYANGENDKNEDKSERANTSHAKLKAMPVTIPHQQIEVQFNKVQLKNVIAKPKRKVILSQYENRLKENLLYNNSIDLYSDSEENTQSDILFSTASKAQILDIRHKLSKKKPQVKKKTIQTNLDQLFNKLKKASKKQIFDHQKNAIESKGLKLEDLKKEKEIVENLLEQEIERNRKIRAKERKRENKKNKVDDKSVQSASDEDDFDHSANELEDSFYNDSDENKEIIEPEEEDSEDDINIFRHKKGLKLVTEESDSENDNPLESEKIPINPNIINLGHYGDNLDSKSTIFNENSKKFIEDIEQFEADNSTENSNNELNELEYKRHIKQELEKQKLKEAKKKAKLRELKKVGASKMFDMEAEESEDEWFGIGGADGEVSDEYDSEVEKLIDDYSRQDFNPDEIRNKLMNENKEMDIKMVNRILYDIKNGGFRKRNRNNIDLELSDDEDDELREYRIKRREIMKKKRLEVTNTDKILKTSKSKAFFMSMVDDIVETSNPFMITQPSDDDSDDNNMDSISNKNHKDANNAKKDKKDKRTDDHARLSQSSRKKFVMSEDFVHKTLSFLTKSKEVNEFQHVNEHYKSQIGTINDIQSLKQKSSIKTMHVLSMMSQDTNVDLDASDKDDDDMIHHAGSFDNSFDDPLSSVSKAPSIIKIFGSTHDINDKFKDGNKTVTISNSYKTVGGMKTSITSFGRRKLVAPVKTHNNFNKNRISNIKSSSNSKLFRNQDKSFKD